MILSRKEQGRGGRKELPAPGTPTEKVANLCKEKIEKKNNPIIG
jgi:hypothetical protein